MTPYTRETDKIMITVKYYWRKLTDDGLIVEFKANYYDRHCFGEYGYDTEEEALKAFSDRFDIGGPNSWTENKFLLVKLYGVK